MPAFQMLDGVNMKVILDNKGWEIVKAGPSKTRDGYCDFRKGKIGIFNNIYGRERTETYVHEFLHALFPKSKEKTIERAARELTIALCKCKIKFKPKRDDG